MALIELIRDPTRKQLRQFGGIFLPVFLVLMAVLVRRDSLLAGPPAALIAVAGASIACALGRPSLLWFPFVGLQYLTFPLGWMLSHLVFGVVYYAVITPLALFVRIFLGDPLERRLDGKAATYWKLRKGQPPLERYFRQY